MEKEREELRKRELERAKPDFEAKFLVSRPAVGRSVGDCSYKPGHWTCVSLEDALANHFDFVGELELAATNSEGRPLPLLASPFEMTICRDMALAKGQAKSLESLLFVPPGNQSATASYRFNAGQGGRRVVDFPPQLLMGHMPSYQYYFLVLARDPELYGHLQGLHSIQPPGNWEDRRSAPYYRVAMLSGRATALAAVARQPVDEHCLRPVGRRLADGLGPCRAAGDARLAALGRAVDLERPRHARRAARQLSRRRICPQFRRGPTSWTRAIWPR